MTGESKVDEDVISPETAFALLGEETRLETLRVLGDADRPLSFSELYERVGYDDSANFNYHLEKLEGHFVRKTEYGYELRQPGARVVEAVVSGAINEAATIAPTETDIDCLLCGEPTVVSYREELVHLYCTGCDGMYGPPDTDDPSVPEALATYGSLGGYPLPPAGLRGRTVESVFETAESWTMSKALSWARAICPQCTAPMEQEIKVCESHDRTADGCPRCGHHCAVLVRCSCTNCPRKERGLLPHYLLPNTEFLSFLTSNGVNPASPMPEFYQLIIDHEEDVISAEPFEARLTFTVGDDSLTVVVEDDLSVTDITRRRKSDTR